MVAVSQTDADGCPILVNLGKSVPNEVAKKGVFSPLLTINKKLVSFLLISYELSRKSLWAFAIKEVSLRYAYKETFADCQCLRLQQRRWKEEKHNWIMANKPLQYVLVERKMNVGPQAGKIVQIAQPTGRHRVDFRSFCERVAKSTTFNR